MKLLLALMGALSAAAADVPPHAPPERAYSAFHDDPSKRFDFWVGRWRVHLRARQSDLGWAPLASATANVYSILNGKAVLELWHSDAIKGFSLRYYDPAAEQWTLWLNWPKPAGDRAFLRGLTGGFRHGRAVFEGEHEQPDGSRIVTRFTFSDITPFSLRWHDEYSRDGGRSWQPNWAMEFTRAAVDAAWPLPPGGAPTVDAGPRCRGASFDLLGSLAGRWVAASGRDDDALRFWEILNGCAVIGLLETDGSQYFLFVSYNTFRNHHELAVLDDRAGTGLRRYFGEGLAKLEGDDGGWGMDVGTENSIEFVIDDRQAGRRIRFERAPLSSQ